MSSEMCSLHLTHPSVHTWSSGQPTVQRPGKERGKPARHYVTNKTSVGWKRVNGASVFATENTVKGSSIWRPDDGLKYTRRFLSSALTHSAPC